jgi:hypothetical protein
MNHEFSNKVRQQKCIPHAFKSPKRITITIPNSTYQYLARQSDEDGRSLSNLAAYLLETALAKHAVKG